MFRSCFRIPRVAVVLPLLSLLLFAPGLSAQTLIRVNEVQVKPTLVERFRAFHLFQVMPSQRNNEIAWRLTQTTEFGDSWQMWVQTPLDDFASLDGRFVADTELRRALFGSALDHRRSFVLQHRPDLSIAGDEGVLPVRRMARMIVKPGSIPAFESYWAATIIPAMRRAGIREYDVYQVLYGGKQGEYYGSIYFEEYAELDGWAILGDLPTAEQQRIQSEFGALLNDMEIWLDAVDGELSFGLPNLQP